MAAASIPIAHVHIPEWGVCRVPVLVIEPDAWTVQGPSGPRSVPVGELNLLHLTVTRCALLATRGGRIWRTAAVPEPVTGAEWRAAASKRRKQLLWCVRECVRVVPDVGSRVV